MPKDSLITDSYFELFSSLTESFEFNHFNGEPANASHKEIHRYRLLTLITHIYRMAKRKYHQMPDAFRTTHEADDWVQEAIIIMFECCKSYDHRGPFDNFVRFKVSKALIDLQRKMFRKNPPTNQTFFKVVQEMKRELGRDPTAGELSERTGSPVEEIESMLVRGFSERVIFTDYDLERHNSGDDDTQSSGEIEIESYASALTNPGQVRMNISSESQYIHHEARRVLWQCLEKLLPEERVLFIQHELKGASFANLFNKHIENISLATFKRRYQSDVYDPVRECVSSQYQIRL